MVRAYTNVATFRCSTLGQTPGLTHKHKTRLVILARDKHSSLLQESIKNRQKKFYSIGPSCQCFITFYICNLRMFAISWSVCPCQAFPTQSNVCGQGQEAALEWSTLNVLHSGRLQKIVCKMFVRRFVNTNASLILKCYIILKILAMNKHQLICPTFSDEEKSFIRLTPRLTPGPNVVFFVHIFRNKLECLPLASVSSLIQQTLKLSTEIRKLRENKFYNIGPCK